MTIETKFKEYDEIYFLHERKVIRSKVRGFKIERRPIEKGSSPSRIVYSTEITYLCSDNVSSNVHIKVNERDGFATKEELLKSL